jgi:O-antigen ligase
MAIRLDVFGGEAAPRWLLAGLVIAIFLFPSVVATTNGGGSYVYALLLLPALFFGRGWRMLAPWERRVLACLLVALAVMALSLVNSEDLRQGMKWLERYLRIALLVPIYLMLRRFGLVLGWALGMGAVAATLVMAGQAWYQVNWLGQPVASGYYHWIVFGDLAVLWGALAVIFALTLVRGWRGMVLGAVAAAAALYASALSQARGAWLFVPVLMLTLVWFYRRQLFASRQAIATTAAVLVLVGAVGVWQADRLTSGVQRGLSDIRTFVENPEAGTSWGIRINLWRNTLLLVQEHPLLGTGLGDFHQEMRDMAADGRSWSEAVADYGHAHSIYFDTLANAGVLGFFATLFGYLLLPLWAFARGGPVADFPERRFYVHAGVVTVLAFATFGVSEALWARNPFVNTYVVCMVVLLAGLASGASDKPHRPA